MLNSMWREAIEESLYTTKRSRSMFTVFTSNASVIVPKSTHESGKRGNKPDRR